MTDRAVRRRARWSTTFALATLLAASAGSRPALADPADEAKARFGRGVDLYKEGDYRAALIEFRRAHDLAPNYRVMFNIGQANLELSDYAGALGAFRRYLDEGKTDVPPEKRKIVEAELAKLESRVARVTIKAEVEGAEITVDDVVVGKTPLADPVLVSAGRRRIALSRAGFPTSARVVDLAGGDKPTLVFEPPKEAPPVLPTATAPPTASAAPVVPPPLPPPPARSMTPVWIGVATTGVLAVGTGVFAGLAFSSKGRLDDRLATVPGNPEEIGRSRDTVKRLSLVADVFGIATVVGAGVTTYLALRPAPSTQVGIGIGSATLTTTF